MNGSQARRPFRESAFWQAYGGRRYAVLFYSLLAMLVAAPIAETFGWGEIVIKLLLAGCLVAAVMPNATTRSRNAFLAAILVLILVRLVSERDDVPIDFGPILILYGLTGLLAAAGTLRFVVRSPTVDSETVYAALSTYLLAGQFFGVIYSAIEYMQPGSFTGPDKFTDAAAVYYSFVTLATLGYGDYTPGHELGRTLAIVEALFGQLYLVTVIAVLVSRMRGRDPAA